jgi:prepilin-type N-terminal cleavage/methylation domain-containing protein
MKCGDPVRRGFTAVELIVGIVIVSLLAGATATSISRLVAARGAVSGQRQAFARASDAASRIALDLANAVRDADLLQCKIEITDSERGGLAGVARQSSDELLLVMRSLRPARGLYTQTGFNEGDEYEAHYRLDARAGGAGARNESRAGMRLLRRLDPALDGFVGGGGVAGAVVDGVASLSIEAYDGTKWFASWDSDRDGLPHAVRVEVVGVSEDGVRTATVRRVVAIDRVPIEPESEEANDESNDSAVEEQLAPAGTGGTGGTGGSGGGS